MIELSPLATGSAASGPHRPSDEGPIGGSAAFSLAIGARDADPAGASVSGGLGQRVAGLDPDAATARPGLRDEEPAPEIERNRFDVHRIAMMPAGAAPAGLDRSHGTGGSKSDGSAPAGSSVLASPPKTVLSDAPDRVDIAQEAKPGRDLRPPERDQAAPSVSSDVLPAADSPSDPLPEPTFDAPAEVAAIQPVVADPALAAARSIEADAREGGQFGERPSNAIFERRTADVGPTASAAGDAPTRMREGAADAARAAERLLAPAANPASASDARRNVGDYTVLPGAVDIAAASTRQVNPSARTDAGGGLAAIPPELAGREAAPAAADLSASLPALRSTSTEGLAPDGPVTVMPRAAEASATVSPTVGQAEAAATVRQQGPGLEGSLGSDAGVLAAPAPEGDIAPAAAAPAPSGMPATGGTAAAPGAPPPQAAIDAARHIAVSVREDPGGWTELRLDPPELGRVRVSLGAGEGGATAVVVAERPETVELLRRHAELLARELAAAGHGRVAVDVSLGGQGGAGFGSAADPGPGGGEAPAAPTSPNFVEAAAPPADSVALGRLDLRL